VLDQMMLPRSLSRISSATVSATSLLESPAIDVGDQKLGSARRPRSSSACPCVSRAALAPLL
jgi:hypothetical protein